MEKFRKLFVIEPSHDVSILKRYTDTVTFLSDGSEKVEDLQLRIEQSLKDFDPNIDAIIPMGRVSACMMTGFYLHRSFPDIPITFGIFNNDKYLFMEMPS